MSHRRTKIEYETEGSYGSRDKAILYCHENLSCDVTTFYYEDGSSIFSFEDCEHPNLFDAMRDLMSGNPETNPKIEYCQIPEYVEPKKTPLKRICFEILKFKFKNSNGKTDWFVRENICEPIPCAPGYFYWSVTVMFDEEYQKVRIDAKTSANEDEKFFEGKIEDMHQLSDVLKMLGLYIN